MQQRWIWVVSLVAAGVLCFLPLTSLLGYESSAVMGVVLGLLTVTWTARELDAPGSPLNTPKRDPLAWWLNRLGARLLFTVPPMLLLGLNALRVKNCDPLQGAVFWLIIPVISVVAMHAAVHTLALAVRSGRRAGRVVLVIVAVDALWFGLRLVFQPPITGMSLLFGYFAGSIYDEALSVPTPLLWYRTWVVALSAAGVLASTTVWRLNHSARWSTTAWGAALSLLATGWLTSTAEDHGYWLEREDIAEALGAEVETEHFIIHYNPGALDAREVQAMADDHEYRYAELTAFLDEDPAREAGGRLHSWVYPDPGTQHRLFGSRNTLVARPWTYEMHIRWTRTGDTSLAHELAHLFTAPFGGGPLKLATDDGLLVHLGLVEGIALAADWPPGELTPHEAAAAMRQLDMAPNLRRLFDPAGFWGQPSGKAYTLMGSFVRWLVDTRGLDDFKRVYKAGDWEGVYGVPVDVLVNDWEAFVDGLPVDESRLELARFKYSKRTIFKKTCARTVAELRRKARIANGQGDYERALELQRTIAGFQGKKKSDDASLDIARLLIRLDRTEEAIAMLDELLGRTGKRRLKPKTRAELLELRADQLWKAGEKSLAAEDYDACLGWGHNDADRRRLALKRLGSQTDDPELSDLAFRYLFRSGGRVRPVWTAEAWHDRDPDDPLGRYLLGFQLVQAGMTDEAIPYLEGAPGSLSIRSMDEQRRLLLARAYHRAGRFDEAQRVWTSLEVADSSRVRLLAAEGLDRLRFAQDLPLPARPPAP